MGYEEASKAYRVFDMEAGQVVITRDVNFDESAFGLSPTIPNEVVEGAALDFDLLEIDERPRETDFKLAGKRKDRLRVEEQASRSSSPVRHGAGLEEASAPDQGRRVKRRSSSRVDWDEEEKGNDQDTEGDASPPEFWRASVNTVEADDLSEPTTFQDAVGGPDQDHWRKAIRAELKSMRLRGVFRAAKLPNGQRAIGTKWVFKIMRKADGSIEKYKARLVAKY